MNKWFLKTKTNILLLNKKHKRATCTSSSLARTTQFEWYTSLNLAKRAWLIIFPSNFNQTPKCLTQIFHLLNVWLYWYRKLSHTMTKHGGYWCVRKLFIIRSLRELRVTLEIRRISNSDMAFKLNVGRLAASAIERYKTTSLSNSCFIMLVF